MNELVRYLGEHYFPRGVSVKFAKFPEEIALSNTDEELFQMIREAKEEDLIVPVTTGINGRWGWDRQTVKDVLFIALTKKGQTWIKQNQRRRNQK
jgi:hypothetical protein